MQFGDNHFERHHLRKTFWAKTEKNQSQETEKKTKLKQHHDVTQRSLAVHTLRSVAAESFPRAAVVTSGARSSWESLF